MDKSNFLELKLPSRNNTTDVADINVISENFEIIDEAFGSIIDDVLPEYQTKENMKSVISDAIVSDKYYPSLNAVRNYITPRDEKIKQHEKRIINIEKRFANEPFEIDDEWGMTKFVPDGVMPYASVNKVGGMSYKSRNLLEVTGTGGTIAGITFTINSDKSITVKGTPTGVAALEFPITLTAGTYILSGAPNLGGNAGLFLIYGDTTISQLYEEVSFTITNTINGVVRVRIGIDFVADSATFYPMIRRATETNTSYEPYYSGLRNAYVSKITATGKNLFAFGNTATDITAQIKANKTQRLILTTIEDNSNKIKCKFNNGSWSIGYIEIKGVDGTKDWAISYDVTENTTSYIPNITKYYGDNNCLQLAISGGNGNNSVSTSNYFILSNIQVEQNTEVTDFTPYKENTFTIPTGARGIGYGLGINEDCYNYIDFERRVYVQNCIELSGFTKSFDKTNVAAWVADKPTKLVYNRGLCSYNAPMINADTDEVHWYIGGTKVWLYAPMGVDVSKETVIAVLETPTETDISDYIQDNFIEVQSGGILTAVNEYNYDTQFEVEYMMGG